MLKNYFKTALRNLLKHRVISMINILGLSVGFTCCILLVLFIQQELSYDKFHTQYDKIYRANLVYNFGGSGSTGITTPTALLPALLREVPEAKTGVRIFNSGNFRPLVVKYQDQLFQESRFFYADSTFFEVFDFDLVKGDPKQALKNPESVILTQSTAEKYFGSTDPVGKTIRVDNRTDFLVTGVMQNLPFNSHLQFDFLASFNSLRASKNEIWWSANYYTYVVLNNKDNFQALQTKTDQITNRVFKDEIAAEGDFVRYEYTPLSDIHLKSELKEDIPGGNIRHVYIFSVIAFLIIAVASINYMNLSTARSVDRIGEVGLRKVFGALRGNLFLQFMSEAILVTFFATLLSLVLANLLMPYYNNLTGRYLSLNLAHNSYLLFGVIISSFLVGLISGCYPSLVLSAFKPSAFLKGGFKRSNSGVLLRKTLVVFQFGISTFLIAATLIIHKQLNFIQNKNLGYSKSQVMLLPLDRQVRKNLEVFKQSVINNTNIINLARAGESPVVIDGGYSISIEGMDEGESLNVNAMSIDHEFIKTLDITLLAGENITEADVIKVKSKVRETVQRSFILNESCVKMLDFSNQEIIGRKVNMNGRLGVVKAVVKDFHFTSLHQKIGPLVLFIEPWDNNFALVKVKPENISGTIAFMKDKWELLFSHRPFNYEFLDDQFNQLYRSEKQIGQVFIAFAAIAIFIACLGLFGLASFIARQRIKEIGIRKIVGASVMNILNLLAGNFVKLVVVAIILAIPIAYLFIKIWLEDFSYKTSIGASAFILAGITSLAIALATISYQTISAANTNPAHLLRNE
ncbi:ABC transporter permease [Fulvivirgaceae bacterium BMA12]|uniref:ABC transporter permease n=1 Tax=Agaribacillus aureus TaxID=3051825 RepID=A0ABT8LDU3_9BACT|nr:ABC transporter permease [Fulvivirgaceae bacterium BMA12]